jgi:hypothetical protein
VPADIGSVAVLGFEFQVLGDSVPHPNRPERDDDEAIQPIGLISQHVVEPLDLRSQVRCSEAKQEHASMRASESNDELTKVEIAGDQNSLLVVSNREDVLIRQTVRMLSTNAGRIMTERQEMRNQSGVRALVEQEPHAEARVAPPATLVSDRSRSSARCA